jgi:hypothetical protein
VVQTESPLSRQSLGDLAERAAGALGKEISRKTVNRILDADAIKPWRYEQWIFPRAADFFVKAARVLDLYENKWEDERLDPFDRIISADGRSRQRPGPLVAAAGVAVLQRPAGPTAATAPQSPRRRQRLRAGGERTDTSVASSCLFSVTAGLCLKLRAEAQTNSEFVPQGVPVGRARLLPSRLRPKGNDTSPKRQRRDGRHASPR